MGYESLESAGWDLDEPEQYLDVIRMTVDGETFEVSTPSGRPDDRHFAWLSGPNPDYGFSSGMRGGGTWTKDELVVSIRDFLSQIDTTTGYIGDD